MLTSRRWSIAFKPLFQYCEFVCLKSPLAAHNCASEKFVVSQASKVESLDLREFSQICVENDAGFARTSNHNV